MMTSSSGRSNPLLAGLPAGLEGLLDISQREKQKNSSLRAFFAALAQLRLFRLSGGKYAFHTGAITLSDEPGNSQITQQVRER